MSDLSKILLKQPATAQAGAPVVVVGNQNQLPEGQMSGEFLELLGQNLGTKVNHDLKLAKQNRNLEIGAENIDIESLMQEMKVSPEGSQELKSKLSKNMLAETPQKMTEDFSGFKKVENPQVASPEEIVEKLQLAKAAPKKSGIFMSKTALIDRANANANHIPEEFKNNNIIQNSQKLVQDNKVNKMMLPEQIKLNTGTDSESVSNPVNVDKVQSQENFKKNRALGGFKHYQTNEVKPNLLFQESKAITEKPTKNLNDFAPLAKDDFKLVDKTTAPTTEKSDFMNVLSFKAETQPLTKNDGLITTPKTLDMSQVQTTDTEKLIDTISNYIQRNSMANRDSLSLKIHHHDLGDMQIQVIKNKMGKGMDIQLEAQQVAGKDFFVENKQKLMDAFSNSGLQISQLKIDFNPHAKNMNFDSRGQQQQSFENNNQQQNMSRNGQEPSEGFDRRKELWEMLKERKSA